MPLFSPSVRDQIAEAGLVAVVVLPDLRKAVPLAEALFEGGVQAIELTLRTEAALDAIREIRTHVPEILIGAGTVLDPSQVAQVQEAGAHFAVSPGTNPVVMARAKERGLSFAPGVVTPSDIELALQHDAKLFKFFPAERSGGLPYLRDIAGPFLHLGVEFLPLGGISMKNASSYLDECDLVPAVGGSWIAPAKAIAESRWDTIASNAKQAVALLQGPPQTS